CADVDRTRSSGWSEPPIYGDGNPLFALTLDARPCSELRTGGCHTIFSMIASSDAPSRSIRAPSALLNWLGRVWPDRPGVPPFRIRPAGRAPDPFYEGSGAGSSSAKGPMPPQGGHRPDCRGMCRRRFAMGGVAYPLRSAAAHVRPPANVERWCA